MKSLNKQVAIGPIIEINLKSMYGNRKQETFIKLKMNCTSAEGLKV